MLFIEIENLVFAGGHIELMLFTEMEKNKFSRQPYWNYTIYRFAKFELTGGHIGIMLFINI